MFPFFAGEKGMLVYIEEVGVTINTLSLGYKLNTVPLGYKLPVRWVDEGNYMVVFLLSV